MKILTIIGTIVLAFGGTVFAGDSPCNTPVSRCFMMPSSNQNSRENLVWIGPACCKPSDNMSADLSGQNSRQGVLSSGKTSPNTVKTTVLASGKVGQFIVGEVETR